MTYIQGLIQIEMLKMMEQMTGKSISELFDWVVGTSTGGILALGRIYGEDLGNVTCCGVPTQAVKQCAYNVMLWLFLLI